MTLDPLLNAPFVIQLHAASAIAASLIGPFAIWRKTRDIWHRLAGALWIVLMLTVANSALFIHTIQLIGPFSPIHLLSGLVYYSLFVAIRHMIRPMGGSCIIFSLGIICRWALLLWLFWLSVLSFFCGLSRACNFCVDFPWQALWAVLYAPNTSL